MLSRWNRAAAVGFWAVVLMGAAAQAALNEVRVAITPTDAGGTGPYDQTVTSLGILTLSQTATGGLASSGTASAHVEYGGNELAGTATGTIDALGKGIYRDNFTITAPSITTGETGHLTFFISIDGIIDATSGKSTASWILKADVGGGGNDVNSAGSFGSPESDNPAELGDPFSTYSATIAFQFGVPTSLVVELTGTASTLLGAGDSAGNATFDLGAYWQGIEFITHDGDEVSGVSLTSDSGTNWLVAFVPSVPVPEPGTAILLAGGLGLLVRRRGTGK